MGQSELGVSENGILVLETHVLALFDFQCKAVGIKVFQCHNDRGFEQHPCSHS